MTRYCFLDVRRVCDADCMAFVGELGDPPKCLLLDTAIHLEKSLSSSDSSITYPLSAPPPEVT